ncbi:MAG: serine hydrolase [Fimbriimonas sp.]
MIAPLLLVPLLALGSPAKPVDLRPLEKRLGILCERLHGRMGYSLTLLNTGQQIDHRGDESFPSASTIKTTIAIEAIRQVDAGKLKWTDSKPVPPIADRKEWEASMMTYHLKEGTSLNLEGWVTLMITHSDNLATRVVREWVDPFAINRTLDSFGLPKTRQLSSFPATATRERKLNAQFGMGTTTPNEMNRLLQMIYHRQVASKAGCERLLRIMGQQYWDDYIGTSAPIEVPVLNKSGAISRSRSDTAIVLSPTQPYVLTIYTDNQKDQRWTGDNEGEKALVQLAEIVWNTLHPNRPYKAPEGYRRFAPTGMGME